MINRNKMTGLGAKEAELIATVGSKGLKIFTVSDAAGLLGITNIAASQIIHRLVEKSKLQRIERAKYLLMPPESWKTGQYTEEGVIIASQMITPYYLSFWTAISFYGWTEQPSRTIFVATQKTKLPIELKGMQIKFIRFKKEKFFGFEEHWVGSQKVVVADKEKTIIDCLDQPRYCGEVVEIAKGLWNGRKELDYSRLLEYALKMKNGAIMKRLGYLMDVLEITRPKFRKKLLKNITPNLALLDPSEKSTTGIQNKEWSLRINVNPDNLTEWRTH